jgi:hypothetical protein
LHFLLVAMLRLPWQAPNQLPPYPQVFDLEAALLPLDSNWKTGSNSMTAAAAGLAPG